MISYPLYMLGQSWVMSPNQMEQIWKTVLSSPYSVSDCNQAGKMFHVPIKIFQPISASPQIYRVTTFFFIKYIYPGL